MLDQLPMDKLREWYQKILENYDVLAEEFNTKSEYKVVLDVFRHVFQSKVLINKLSYNGIYVDDIKSLIIEFLELI